MFESTSIAHSTGRPESEAVETRPIAPPVHPLAERERERERDGETESARAAVTKRSARMLAPSS